MRLLSLGYFLSVINALIFSLPTILYLPALAAYPASIILRGWGWRSLGKRLGALGNLYPAIWILGGATYAAILSQSYGLIEYGLLIALATWASYSAIEAALYLRTASKLKLRPLYFSPISLVGVSTITFVFLMSSRTIQFMEQVRYGELTYLVFASSATLAASALLTALTTLRIGAETPTGEREVEALLVSTPQRTTPRRTINENITLHIKREKPPKTARVATVSGPLIRIEVISRSNTVVCSKCGAGAPIGTDKCLECGEPFKKAATALRCPVCKAPFSMARAVSQRHYVCGQCFSDLRVLQR
ncbi:MAG: zinc ribbon domain-containing protein [Nitrososphaerota archaeon]